MTKKELKEKLRLSIEDICKQYHEENGTKEYPISPLSSVILQNLESDIADVIQKVFNENQHQELQCPRCGNTELYIGQQFCQICGKLLTESAEHRRETVYEDSFTEEVGHPEIDDVVDSLIEKGAVARELHCNLRVKPEVIPMLWIRDKATGDEHLFGTDTHDKLEIDAEGNLQYYNMKHGEGTGGCGYEWVSHNDGVRHSDILYYSFRDKNVF